MAMPRTAVFFEKPENLSKDYDSVRKIQSLFAQEIIFIQLKRRGKKKYDVNDEQLNVKNLFKSEKFITLNSFTSIFLSRTKLDTFLLDFFYEPKLEDSYCMLNRKLVSFTRVKLCFELFILNSLVNQIFRFKLNKTIQRIQNENISLIVAVENESFLYSQNLELISKVLNVPIQKITLK